MVDRDIAVPPTIAPERWEDYEGFRETYLRDFTVPAHNATLRAFADVLSTLASEAACVLPKPPEGWYRSRVRAVLGDLRFLQGYIADLADDHTVVPRDSEHLARLAHRKSVSVGKIADAFEAALAQPVEDE